MCTLITYVLIINLYKITIFKIGPNYDKNETFQFLFCITFLNNLLSLYF